MKKNSAGSVPNYQALAKGFSVGDSVLPIGQPVGGTGKITKIYEGLGVADVEFNGGNRRMPVEGLMRVDPDDFGYAPDTNSVAGGEIAPDPFGSRDISMSSPSDSFDSMLKKAMVEKVSQAWVKTSLYWAARDRKYRANKGECSSGYSCPRCQAPMKKAIYKRQDNSSEKLWGCPECMFLIKNSDIIRYDGEY